MSTTDEPTPPGARPSPGEVPASPVTASPARRRWRRGAIAVALLAAYLLFVPSVLGELFWGHLAPPIVVHPLAEPHGHARRLVLLITIDGLSTQLLSTTATPTLDRLVRDGTVADEAVAPATSTLAAHATLISGLPPDRHGLGHQGYRPWRSLGCDTIFTVCERHRYRCAIFSGKRKLASLARDQPGVERFEFQPTAEKVLAAAARYVTATEPDLVMIHLAEVDHLGHRSGWTSDPQRAALAALDAGLERFLADLPAGRPRVVLLTADHGGEGRHHQAGVPAVLEVPWILWGDEVPRGIRAGRVESLDTAPTLASLLDATPPSSWPGRSRAPRAPGPRASGPTDGAVRSLEVRGPSEAFEISRGAAPSP